MSLLKARWEKHQIWTRYWKIQAQKHSYIVWARLRRRKVHRRRTSVSPEPKGAAAAGAAGGEEDDAEVADAAGTPQPSPGGERSDAEEGDALTLTPEGTPCEAEEGDVVSPLVSPRGERRSRSRAGSRPASAGAGASKIGRKRSRMDEILVKVAAEVEAEAAAAGLLEASPQRFAEALERQSLDEDEAEGTAISGSGLPVQRALDAELLQAARPGPSQEGAVSLRGDGSSVASTPRDGRPARAGEPGAPSGAGGDGQEALQPGSAQATQSKGDLAQQQRQKSKGAVSAVVGDGQGWAEDAEGLEDGYVDGERLLPGRPGGLSADEGLARGQRRVRGARDGVVLDELEGDADTLAQRRASHLGASVSLPDVMEGRVIRQLQQEQQRSKKAADAARVDVHASAADKAALGQLADAEKPGEGVKSFFILCYHLSLLPTASQLWSHVQLCA